MLKRFILTLVAVTLVGMALVAYWPTTSPASPILTPVATTPSATPSLPACANEDGSGQMLCVWDASESGNGVGTDAVAGDCSTETVGSQAASDLCVRLYTMGATHTTNADGSSVDVPNGKALVSECLDIAYEGTIDSDAANALSNEGWTIEECFKGFIEN